jgi:guanosine-3',5'-bis(diphosphate) 3'-pyrophosphohydrolase
MKKNRGIFLNDQQLTSMELTDRQWKLFDYIRQMHDGQMRKYKREPYFTHLMRVADKVSQYDTNQCAVEIALCHDLIEDTSAGLADLSAQLIAVGYSVEEDTLILGAVDELTDHFTKTKFPELNRRKRKKLEAQRMIGMRPVAQTVKYADVIDNVRSIVSEDPAFARIYLAEIRAYLGELDKGDPGLYAECLSVFNASERALGDVVLGH